MVKKLITVSVASLLIGILIGRVSVPSVKNSAVPKNELEEVRETGYKFISPLLECEAGKDSYKLIGLNPVQIEVNDFVEKEKANGNIVEAAIYFRDLNNGPWFGVNEHTAFSPASLLKLPVMMAYFKKAEEEPALLDKKVKYEAKDALLGQDVAPETTIKKGESYAIGDLIERMMVYSDNAALTVLEDNIEPAQIDKITLDLGVETATDTTPLDFMSVKGYAGLFRILYNASYLEKSYSEKALEIMSRSDFADGIVAGVPKGIVVSHKFGERQLEANSVQLHDCGVVYRPKNPYLLCIMTKGGDFSRLAQFIKQSSKIVYDGIGKRVMK